MNAHRITIVCRLALIAFLGLGLLSSAQAAGTVWVSDSFGQSGDRVGQFADRGEGKWDQVLKNRQRLHSYRQTSVTDQYVEISGSGGVGGSDPAALAPAAGGAGMVVPTGCGTA